MSTPSTIGTKFPLYQLNEDGSIDQIGEVLGRMVKCLTEECWAKNEEIEVADDGNIVICGACGKEIESATDHGAIIE